MIIDASVGVKWVPPTEEDADIAHGLIGAHDLVVPTLFYAEVANAVWKKARKGEIVVDELAPHLSIVRQITRELPDVDFVERALTLALELDHPVYDCIYLAAAEATDDLLLTADVRFLRRVRPTAQASRVLVLADLQTWTEHDQP